MSAGEASLEAGNPQGHLAWVARTLFRCIRLLRPVIWHLLVLGIGFSLLWVLLVPSILVLFDLLWTRALQGQPLSEVGAALLELDPSRAVHVAQLDVETRKKLARAAIFGWLVLGGVFLPISLGLYYYQVWILQRVNQTLRLELLDRLQTLSLRFHSDQKVGDALYRLYQDSAMVTRLVDVLFITPLGAIAVYLGVVAIVSAFELRMGLILAAVWPPTLLLGAWFSGRLRTRFRAAREANSALTSRIQETLIGIKVVKAYAAEKREQERFERASREAFRAAYGARTLLASFGISIFWVVGVALVIAAGLATLSTALARPMAGGAAVAALGIAVWNLGTYNAFKFFFGNGTDRVRLLYSTWGRTQDIVVGLDRVFELLDYEPEVVDTLGAAPLAPIKRGVRFEQVHFRYDPDRPALEGIDLEARVGEMTAIVGPTGSGKSTMVSLLLRLFDPERGRVEIDGVDIRTIALASLRSRVAIALQENLLFGTTVRENIRYAVPDASDEEVRSAAKIACADEFISELSEGYDTLLGERGTKLSSGQRQRLSIARAILKDPDLLILDEPTASLDAETELQLLKNLNDWGQSRAVLLITHRLAAIRRADQIAFLRDGKIVEQGSHPELMARHAGAYRAFAEIEGESDRANPSA